MDKWKNVATLWKALMQYTTDNDTYAIVSKTTTPEFLNKDWTRKSTTPLSHNHEIIIQVKRP